MRLFRLCHAAHPPFDGAGAASFGGRWNPPGIPVAYAASTRALAILERVVHNKVWMPTNDALWQLDVPDELVETSPLPDLASLEATQRFGASWCQTRATLALLVPSVVAGECNILLNPQHPALAQLAPQLLSRPFVYDARLRPPGILEPDGNERLRIRGTQVEAREILTAYDPAKPFQELLARFPALDAPRLHEALGLLLRPEVQRQALRS